uniref:Uncharacterized protein n=1 Tax=Denticeps clupeoides TaxID=299321 RepID=A0AAY4EK32_9TELE
MINKKKDKNEEKRKEKPVYKARSRHTGQMVAVKRIRVTGWNYAQRIVEYYWDKTIYVSMELCSYGRRPCE